MPGFKSKRGAAQAQLDRPIEADYTSHAAYTRALEQYCDTLAQPEQEPVLNGWRLRDVYFDADGEPSMHRAPEQERTTHITWDERGVRTVNGVPDDAPRPWVGLTDEEIYMNCPPWLSQEQCKMWVQHIEAKLKEKNT